MRKINVALIGLLFSLVGFAYANEAATTYQEGVHYTKLDRAPSEEPEVIEVFSFLCPACNLYENELQIPKALRESLAEKKVKFSQYSLASFGQLGPQLSQAWAIANALGIQDKVTPALYEAIHTKRNIKSEADIRKVFTQFDVSEDKYEKMKTDFVVRAFTAKQDATIKALGAQYLPVFYVNGQYRIESKALHGGTNEEVTANFVKLIDYLLQLK